jgi:hypothetical protein
MVGGASWLRRNPVDKCRWAGSNATAVQEIGGGGTYELIDLG